jgi:hypothetical protein
MNDSINRGDEHFVPTIDCLLKHLGDHTRTNGFTTFPDGKVAADIEGDWLVQTHRDTGVVTGHDHFGSSGQLRFAGHIRRPKKNCGLYPLKNGVCRPPSD